MQKTVNLYPARGLPGQEVNVHTAIYTPFNYLSDGTAAVGSFVFAKEVTNTTGAVIFQQASATGTGKPLGFVERVLTGALGYKEDGSMIYAEGAELTIARRGDYYAANAGGAKIGQSVLCDPATGEITYGNAGDANDTGWVVYAVGADEDEPIIISNRGVDVAAAGGSAPAGMTQADADLRYRKISDKVNVASDVTGTLGIANGGTGATTAAAALEALGGQPKA